MDKTLQQIIQLFYQIGIWQRDDESNLRKILKKIFYSIFSAFFPIFFLANAYLCADQSESIFSVQTAVIATVVYVKFVYLVFKKNEILAFLNDQIVVHSIEDRDDREQTSKKITKFMGFVRPYCIAIFTTVPFVIVIKLPIFTAEKGLPFFISISWNDSEIIYWLVYFYVSLSALLYITINLITPLIWFMMLNYSIEYELLGNKFRKLGVGTKTVETSVKKYKNIRSTQRSMFVEDLIVMIKAHQNLNQTIQRFRSCFSTLFLAQMSTTGIVICASVYNLAFVSNQNIVQTEFYVVVLLYGIFDIFLVLYLANDITIASDRLAYCLFESNWIEQTESCKKYVLIMGEVLKQMQQLVIIIYPMNLETFMKIINGAYSMFNILKSFQ